MLRSVLDRLTAKKDKQCLEGSVALVGQHLELKEAIHNARAKRFDVRIDNAHEGVVNYLGSGTTVSFIRADPRWRRHQPQFS